MRLHIDADRRKPSDEHHSCISQELKVYSSSLPASSTETQAVWDLAPLLGGGPYAPASGFPLVRSVCIMAWGQ